MKMTVMLVAVPAGQTNRMVDKFPPSAQYWGTEISSENMETPEYMRHAGVVCAEQLWKQRKDAKAMGKPAPASSL